MKKLPDKFDEKGKIYQNKAMNAKKEEFKLKRAGEIRTRFAPSPTGRLHIGGARTALFNYLFTRKNEGRFILRIEDTDKERSKKEYEEVVYDSLSWLGIEWDEGPKKGGKYGPYRQSERKKIYKKYLKKLLEEGRAYYCFCSEEDLEAQRQYFRSIGKPPVYNGHCRDLSDEEVREKIKKGENYIIRFKNPQKEIIFKDMVRGEVEFDTSLFGDFSLAKNLNEPLYNLACVIDDHLMKITHVIRGEDHLPNTPKQILLYENFGWDIPEFAHLPLILAPDKSKLSKRHGSVSVTDFKKEGYLPQALVNFIAFLGWNPGTAKEIYTLKELINDFSLGRVRSAGAVFNRKRLDHLNGVYIRKMPMEEFLPRCLAYLEKEGLIQKGEEEYVIKETSEKIGERKLQNIISLYKERLKRISEIPALTEFFFRKELNYSGKLLIWKDQTREEVIASLDKLHNLLSSIENWGDESLKNLLLPAAKEWGQKLRNKNNRGYLLWPMRVALTGQKASAGPFDIAEILGKKTTLKRIKRAREILKNEKNN